MARRHHRRFEEFIGGAWVTPASGEYMTTSDPSTGDTLAEVAKGNTDDVEAAVAAARKALPAWQALSGHERARYLYALARQVQKHSRRLAVLETMDNGKPIRESRDIDIPLVARHFYHHAGWAQLLESEFPNYTACGVVGQVIPWNFPLLMFAWKVAPALAAGNTVVIKPAKYTPLTALAFAELAMEVGLPPGVLNVLTCDAKTGPGAHRASRHRQGRLYRLDGSGPHHPQGHGELDEEALARTRRQIALRGLRRCRSRLGRRGPGGRHLVQPGPGVLRGLAAAGAGARGGDALRQGSRAHGNAARGAAAR